MTALFRCSIGDNLPEQFSHLFLFYFIFLGVGIGGMFAIDLGFFLPGIRNRGLAFTSYQREDNFSSINTMRSEKSFYFFFLIFPTGACGRKLPPFL